jgi:hypothetical protein
MQMQAIIKARAKTVTGVPNLGHFKMGNDLVRVLAKSKKKSAFT